MGNIAHITIGEIVEIVATFSIDRSFLGQKGVVTRVDGDRNVVRVQGPFLGGSDATPWDVELKADEWKHAPENQDDPPYDRLLGDVSPEEAIETIDRLKAERDDLDRRLAAAEGRANVVLAKLKTYQKEEWLDAKRVFAISMDHSESNVGEGRKLAMEVAWWRAEYKPELGLEERVKTLEHQLQEVRTAREMAEAQVARLAPLEARASQHAADYQRVVRHNVELKLRNDYLECLHRAGGLRLIVLWFAQQMEQKLRENDHKGGWHHNKAPELVSRLLEEVAELRTALTQPGSAETVAEAADVANFAMMIADNRVNGR